MSVVNQFTAMISIQNLEICFIDVQSSKFEWILLFKTKFYCAQVK